MSAFTLNEIEVRPAPTQRIRPAARPLGGRVPSAASQSKAKWRAAERVIVKAIGLGCVAAAGYVGTCLSGHVMLEQARHDQIRAIGRAETARKLETSLRTRLDEILRPDQVEAWALSHGFVARNSAPAPTATSAPDTVSRPSAMVAMREP